MLTLRNRGGLARVRPFFLPNPIRQWRQDSRDLEAIIEARKISYASAINVLAVVIAERNTGRRIDGPWR